ncbi:MAG: DUF6089 family protein [Prevotella sp.]
MRAIIIAALLLLTTLAKAQEDYEYRLELGGGIGLVSYQGDFNGSILKCMQPMADIVARLKPNPRMAFAFNIGLGNLKADYANAGTYYPELPVSGQSFSNLVIDGGARFEYNFWPYGTGHDYRGARRFTPFVTMGLGLTCADADNTSALCVNLPIGGGVKYKLGRRLNLTLEWTMHFSTSDKLDGVTDPYGIKSSGPFKNKDSYSILLVGLTYDMWAKCRTCHNDDD